MNLVGAGMQVTAAESCDAQGSCTPIGATQVVPNPSLAQQLFTGAAMMGSAAIIEDELGDNSSTNVNVNNKVKVKGQLRLSFFICNKKTRTF